MNIIIKFLFIIKMKKAELVDILLTLSIRLHVNVTCKDTNKHDSLSSEFLRYLQLNVSIYISKLRD